MTTNQKNKESLDGKAEGFLPSVRLAVKLYDKFLDPLRLKYGLTKLELVVVGFLHNNPQKNTVGEIASIRSLSKGNVSCAVDSLYEKGLLKKQTDAFDRRTVHLFLEETALPIVEEIEQKNIKYKEAVLRNFAEQEIKTYFSLSEKMLENMQKTIETLEHEGE